MGGKSEEFLLGFDAREMGVAKNWPPEILLRDGVARVLSVDTMVWPSLFSFPPWTPDLERPAWIGANGPFWEDLALLEASVATVDRESFPHWLIAATWHTDMGFQKESRQWKKYASVALAPHCVPANPATRDPGWLFLGFDVADPSISGLSNCGYTEDERPALVQQWSPWLNRHNLFSDLEKAFEFRMFSNTRVREHAPFYVIGLWLVREAASPE